MAKVFPTNPALSLSNLVTATQGCGHIAESDVVVVSTAATETPIFYVSNPSNSGLSLVTFVRRYSLATLNGTGIFKVYANPTVSVNGTAVGINNLRVNSSAPTSKMNAYKSPTVSSNGTLISSLTATYVEFVSELPYILDAGNSLLVTATVGTNSDSVIVELAWFELNC